MRDVPEPDAFILDRPREHYLQYGWGRHTCLGQYVSPVIIVESMIALLGLQDLRGPEPRAGEPSFPVRAALRPISSWTTRTSTPLPSLFGLPTPARRGSSGRSRPPGDVRGDVTCRIERHRKASVALRSPLLTASGCSRGRDEQAAEYAAAANGRVRPSSAPLEDDTSDEIMSWVDGQVVADWAAEIGKREQAIERYLNDTDPARAEKYGFRSGQNPQLAWSWFRDNPVGFNGVPFVLFKTISRSRSEPREPDAPLDRADLEARSGVPARSEATGARWTIDHIGMGPNPADYVDGVARPAGERQSPLPFGFAFENPRSFEPLSAAETKAVRRTAAGPPRVSEHEPARREAASDGTRGELGAGSAGLREPRARWIACSCRARPATSAG